MEQSVQRMEQEQEQGVDADGRYPSSLFPGCLKTFAHHRKLRKDHEAKHNPPVIVNETPVRILYSKL